MQTDTAKIIAAIAGLEAQRALLGDAVVDTALSPLKQQLAQLEAAPASSESSEGERKLVTIMFADISGFTALSETLDPEEVRNLINGCFDVLVPIVTYYGGTIDKFIGDAILALFGAPVAYENHAERALRAALDMAAALETFNAEHQIALGLHFGINTGLVIAGGIGSQGQQQYSVMGDAVNLAARLEDASETGEILVGQTTYRLTAPLFLYEVLPAIKVKGKAEPVPIYRLTGLKNVPGTLRGIEGLYSPLVGRTAEMECIRQYLDDVQTGKGGMVAVVGEAGVGKSRLLAQARQTLGESVTWAEGRCLSYAENVSYRVASEILYSLISANQDMPPQEIAAALYGSVSRQLGEQSPDVYPYLARLLNLPLDRASADRVQYLTAETLRARMLDAYGTYVRARASSRPTVLVWEDMHWVDPSSLAILEKLVPLTKAVPLVLVLVFRPDTGRIVEFHKNLVASEPEVYSVIELQPLSRDSSIRLLNNLLHLENLPTNVQEMILEKTEGNAFFLEEVLRSLIEAGWVVIDHNQVSLSKAIDQLKALDVPDTLQGVIAERIDRLPGEYKQTLQTASVIGRVFQESVLSYLFEREVGVISLHDRLDKLQEREFIRLRAELEYIFKHAVTQDVAYNSLLIGRRKALHRVTAEAIESLFPDHHDGLAATIAYHYQQAEEVDKALEYLMKAANTAKRTYANSEAITFYHAALEQAARLPDGERQTRLTAELYENLADVLMLTGQHEVAHTAYEKTRIQVAAHDLVTQARLYRKMSKTREVQRQYDEALDYLTKAETILTPNLADASIDCQSEWVEIQLLRIRMYYWLNQQALSNVVIETLQPVVNSYGTPIQRATFFTSVALARLRQERYVPSPEALRYAHAGAVASRELDNLAEVAWNQFAYGFFLLWNHQLEEAENELKSALKVTERTGDVVLQSRCLTYLSIVYRKRCAVERVRELSALSLVAANAGDMIEYVGMAHGNLAWADVREGNTTPARENSSHGLQLMSQTAQSSMFPWVCQCPLIEVNLIENRLAEAIEIARAAITQEGQPLPDAMTTLIEKALQAWKGGDTEQTRTLLEQAVLVGKNDGYT